jgi:hypothetical protein
MKHDERRDAQFLSKKCIVDAITKTITASHSTQLGNKSWGRIDFLCHYCGWIFLYGNTEINKKTYDNDKEIVNIVKKESKVRKFRDNV